MMHSFETRATDRQPGSKFKAKFGGGMEVMSECHFQLAPRTPVSGTVCF